MPSEFLRIRPLALREPRCCVFSHRETNRKLQDELSAREVFDTLPQAEVLVARWQRHHSHLRPHSALGRRPPAPEAVLPGGRSLEPTPLYAGALTWLVVTSRVLGQTKWWNRVPERRTVFAEGMSCWQIAREERNVAEGILAFHVDLERAMWRREYADGFVETLARWGFNTIVYQLEDKLHFSGHPALAHPDAATHRETADFVAACRAKNVDVIPLLQSLGHAEAVVGKPEYAHLREAAEIEDQYDPLSEEARALLIQLFDQTIDVFQPREYFHMGGDETWSLGKSRKCASIVAEIGIGGLYLRHMMPLFEHIHKRGLRPIIWADMALSYPEIINDIPHYVVMMDWDYWTREARPRTVRIWGGAQNYEEVDWERYRERASQQFRQHFEVHCVDDQTRQDGTFRPFYCTDALRVAGFDVLTASASRSGGDMTGTPRYNWHLPNCYYSARKGLADGIGNLVTSWALRHNHPELSLPGAYAASLALTTQRPFDHDTLGKAFAADHYGADVPEFAPAAEKAGAVVPLGPAHQLLVAREKLRSEDDPVAEAVTHLDRQHGGRKAAIGHIEQVRSGYAYAQSAFVAMKDRAERNARNLDYWLEGVAVNTFYADFLLAALAGNLKTEASDLLARLSSLRSNTRCLFEESYAARSVSDELDLRYGFHEDYLLRSTPDRAHQ